VCNTKPELEASIPNNCDVCVSDKDFDSDDSPDKTGSVDDDDEIDDAPHKDEPPEYITMFISRSWECLLHLLQHSFSPDQDHKSPDSYQMDRDIQSTLGHLAGVATDKQFLSWLNVLLNNVVSR